MLTASDFDTLSVPIVNLYERYMTSVIEDIARRLSKMDMTDAAAWQMQRLIESGAVYENALAEIAKLTGQSEMVLRETFEQAGVKSMRFDDAIYRQAGLEPIPLNMSPAMVDVMKIGFAKTSGLMQNLTLTTALDAQLQFTSAADLAYMQVSTGAMSYDEAITQAVRGIGDSGLFVHYPSGHRDRLDVAMRRATLTGVSQTTAELQLSRMDEMGTDLVQVSAHIGSRESHAEWQGKVFSRSGAKSDYPDFVESTGYGDITGLGGVNCRHSFYPFFEGISENAYNAQDREQMKTKTVTYNGKKLSVYEATQEQRRIERNIRQYKRREAAHLATNQKDAEIAANSLVRKWQGEMRSLVQQTNLTRLKVDGVYVREKV